MEKEKGLKGLTRVLDERKNSWLIEIEAYMTRSYQWEMYRLLRKDCGDIIHKETTFWMPASHFCIISPLSRPYLFMNSLSGVQVITHILRDSL